MASLLLLLQEMHQPLAQRLALQSNTIKLPPTAIHKFKEFNTGRDVAADARNCISHGA